MMGATRLGAAALFGLGLYGLADSHALPRAQDEGFLSWTPAQETAQRVFIKHYAAPEPTAPPAPRIVEAQLAKRQSPGQLCGFINGDIFSSVGCVRGYECAYDDIASVVGCCPPTGLCDLIGDCYAFTQSRQYSALPSLSQISALYCSRVGMSNCATFIYSGGSVDGMSAFGCTSVNTVLTVFEEPGGTDGDVGVGRSTASTPTIPFGTLGVTPTRGSNSDATSSSDDGDDNDDGNDDDDSESAGAKSGSSGSKSNNTGKIVGGVVGGVLGIVLLGVGALFLWRRKNAADSDTTVPPVQEQPYPPQQGWAQQPQQFQQVPMQQAPPPPVTPGSEYPQGPYPPPP
ncbi:unnamed protein product [Parascedosporium putredinis]|uniref:Uncharacterized protein n=1 Tax=Parascedosporium putredinis TaxID=1442378 RepID=A0A9P1M6M7_9PEZI|nr:unnamed protein product [Parascedosporium putredinis]CAI7987507.1 unnamed protein product [Parascedosporium putredinis]